MRPGRAESPAVLGSERVAQALDDAGVRVVTHVPGHGATEIFEAWCARRGRQFVSYHEEVAYTVAHGAALCGAPSAVVIKSHGLAKAANSVVDSLAAGVTAGMVVVVVHDPLARHSDTVLDTEQLLRGLGLPFVSPPGDPYQGLQRALHRSRSQSLPWGLVLETEEVGPLSEPSGPSAPPERQRRPGPTPSYRRDVARHLVCPLLSQHQRDVLRARRSGHRAPLPPRLPTVQEALGPRAEPYEAVFAAFRRVRGPVVAGDTSLSTLFALPPWDCVDLCTCMGGSISLALGAMLAGFQDVWAVTGDFSFVAAGHLGLLEAAGRGLPLKVLIFWNGRAAATGGQPVDPALFEGILAGYPGRVARVGRHHGPQAIEQVLRQAASSPGLRLVVADVA